MFPRYILIAFGPFIQQAMSRGTIFETQDGSHSIYSEDHGVSYHSRYGAVQESQHVFIEGGLRHLAVKRSSVAVLELGFGTGLNAYLSLLEANARKLELYYEAVEAYPISIEQASLLNYPSRVAAPASLSDQFMQLHTLTWDEEHSLNRYYTFKKVRSTFENYRPQSRFDVVFFDAFAPNAQPELWDEKMLEKMYEALTPEGVLVTYCAKGVVKRRLRAVGFEVEALPGPPGKREMTRGIKHEAS